jgi:hypothetical protein
MSHRRFSILAHAHMPGFLAKCDITTYNKLEKSNGRLHDVVKTVKKNDAQAGE